MIVLSVVLTIDEFVNVRVTDGADKDGLEWSVM
jgi:hypothetical protein